MSKTCPVVNDIPPSLCSSCTSSLIFPVSVEFYTSESRLSGLATFILFMYASFSHFDIVSAIMSRKLHWVGSLMISSTNLPCISYWGIHLISSVNSQTRTMFSGIASSPQSHCLVTVSPMSCMDQALGRLQVLHQHHLSDAREKLGDTQSISGYCLIRPGQSLNPYARPITHHWLDGLLKVCPKVPFLIECHLQFCLTNDLDFLSTRIYIGLWIGIIALVISSFEGSVFVKLFTRFTEEIFAALIALLYMVDSFTKVYQVFKKYPLLYDYCSPSDIANTTETMSNMEWYSGDSELEMLSLDQDFNYTTTISSVDQSNSSFQMRAEIVDSFVQPNTALFCFILSLGTFFIAYYLRQFRNSKFLGRNGWAHELFCRYCRGRYFVADIAGN
uniref:Bicarbonate transporter-like transmembrane domain-containing protein n=1 Tax=Timema monikensis TaxID=170555 RepID=A0A7R9HTS9_9NEOP|nr:unnamed protein product [Timema monikensis]